MRQSRRYTAAAGVLALVGLAAAAHNAQAPFTIALIPDTQNYTERDPWIYYEQMDYLVKARDSLNLAFAIHLGDLTDSNLEIEEQWEIADSAHRILDNARLPYSVIPGNHDMPELGDSVLSRDLSVYKHFFGPRRFMPAGQPMPWTGYGEAMTNAAENAYWLFESSGLKFLVLGLELAPRKDALCWANEIAKRFSDRRVIVATHCYQSTGGGHKKDCATRYGLVGSGGDITFSELAQLHSNIVLVVSGHVNEAAHYRRERNFGPGRKDTLHEIITDYQNERRADGKKSGNGWLRLMTFFPENDSVQVTAHTVVPSFTTFNQSSPPDNRYSANPRHRDHTFPFRLELGALPSVTHIDALDRFHDRTVNPRSRGQQRTPAVAAAPDGRFIVAWADERSEGSSTEVHARAFDANGCELFRLTPAHGSSGGIQRNPAVAIAPNGNSVLVWEADRDNDHEYDVYATGFKNDGSIAFEEIRVSTGSTGQQLNPSVGMAASGDFVVVWQDDSDAHDGYRIKLRRFGSNGAPAADAAGSPLPEIAVNSAAAGHQRRPDVAVRPNGDHVVTWDDSRDGTGSYDVMARGFRASGADWISELRVNATAAGNQLKSAVAITPSGRFVVAWADDRNDNDTYQIRARRFDHDGTPMSGDRRVNTVNTGQQIDPDVAVTPNGSFVVVWADDRNDNATYQIRARTYDQTGAPQPADVVVNFNSAAQQLKPATALMSSSGRFVVVWEDDSNGNDQFEILARGMPRPSTW